MATQKIIAVVGATGAQGGGVVDALKQQGTFRIRALTRKPERYTGAADEVRLTDLNAPQTLGEAFEDVYGVFAVTNAWDQGANALDELAQGKAAVEAAVKAGVQHFVWSSLPNVEALSRAKYDTPHFTNKAKVNEFVKQAGFAFHTFVEAPFYYQNFLGVMAPQRLEDGTTGWMMPIDPTVRCIHMGDISQLGLLVAGALANPAKAGSGQTLSLAGDFVSFNDVAGVFNTLGRKVSVRQIPKEVYAASFPGAAEMGSMLAYFEEYTYLGPDSANKIALAKAVTTQPFTTLQQWAKANADKIGVVAT